MAAEPSNLGPGYLGNDVVDEWVAPLICEFIGPLVLVFAGAGATIMTANGDPANANIVAIAFAYGLALGVFVAAAGHISGGSYNPAVTIGLLAGGKLSLAKSIGYIVVELAGGVIGALLLKSVFPTALTDPVALGTPAVGGRFTPSEALLAEIVTTFFLMFVIYGTVIDNRGPRVLAGLAIGLTITMDVFCVGNVSGAAMNPARHFGPALVQNAWSSGWIWYVGPVLGALIAAVLYAYVLMPFERSQPPAPPASDVTPPLAED